MATKKISELDSAEVLDGSESIPIVQSSTTVKTTVDDIKYHIEPPLSIPPKYVRERHIIFREWCNDSSEWNVFHGTKSDDIVNYLHSPNFQNVKLTGAAGDSGLYATKILSAAVRLNNRHITFYYYIPSGSTIHYVKLHFDSSASYDAWTDYFEQTVYAYNDAVSGYSGWHLFTATIDDGNWTQHGTPDWNNIKYVRIYTETDSTTNSTVVIGPIYGFVPPNAKGIILLGMDGAYSGQKQACSYANSKGIPVTLFVSEPIVGGVGRLTLAELQDIRRCSNNLIASYVYALTTNWQVMTTAQKALALKMNAVWLKANGFGEGSRFCSPPGVGVRSEEIDREIMMPYIDIPAGFNAGESNMGTLWDVKKLNIQISPASIEDSSGDPGLASLLSQVIAGRGVGIELWHSPYDNIDGTSDTWEAHIDDLKTAMDAGQIEVVTPLDLWNKNIEINIPSFLVMPSGNLLNVTGDGTAYTVVFATTIFDINKDFNGTSTFYAPMKGKYQLNAQLRLSGLEAASTNVIMTLQTTKRGYQNRCYPIGSNARLEIDLPISVVADMDAGDIAYVSVQVDGGTKVVDITATLAYFSGHYICE